MAMSAPRPRPVLPIGPLLLIGLGVLLLLTNVGLVSWEVWPTILRYWPLALVLLGVQALISGRVDWTSLVLLLLAVVVVWMGTQFETWSHREQRAFGPPTTDTFRQPLEGARAARLEVEFGAGALRVDGAAPSGLLASGGLNGAGPGRLRTEYRVRDGVGLFSVEAAGAAEGRFPFWHRMDDSAGQLTVSVSPDVPLELVVEAGAADAVLDLRELQISSLRYETGASRSTVVLPARGITRADIRGGASSMAIEVPPGVAARIQTSGSGLSDVNIDQSRFSRNGDVYQSADYPTAPNRVDLRLEVGLANVTVR
jgi:hypothetical protein